MKINWKDIGIRCLKTFIQGVVAYLAVSISTTDFTDKEAWEVLEMIGKKRGMMIKGGEIDFERASVMLLDEYRGGKLGVISLEKPE